jgi:hypothetical protein
VPRGALQDSALSDRTGVFSEPFPSAPVAESHGFVAGVAQWHLESFPITIQYFLDNADRSWLAASGAFMLRFSRS